MYLPSFPLDLANHCHACLPFALLGSKNSIAVVITPLTAILFNALFDRYNNNNFIIIIYFAMTTCSRVHEILIITSQLVPRPSPPPLSVRVYIVRLYKLQNCCANKKRVYA